MLVAVLQRFCLKNDYINHQIGLTIYSLLISAHQGTVNV